MRVRDCVIQRAEKPMCGGLFWLLLLRTYREDRNPALHPAAAAEQTCRDVTSSYLLYHVL